MTQHLLPTIQLCPFLEVSNDHRIRCPFNKRNKAVAKNSYFLKEKVRLMGIIAGTITKSNEKQYWPKKQEGLGPAVDFKEEKCYSWIKASWPTLGKERASQWL